MSRSWDHVTRIRLKSDATAAHGMCKREGLGRVRHWRRATCGCSSFVATAGWNLPSAPVSTTPSDMGTKGLGREAIRKLMVMLGYDQQSGRPSAAPIRACTVLVYAPTDAVENSDGED